MMSIWVVSTVVAMIQTLFGMNMEPMEADIIANPFGTNMELMEVNTIHYVPGIHIPQIPQLLWIKKAISMGISPQTNTNLIERNFN